MRPRRIKASAVSVISGVEVVVSIESVLAVTAAEVDAVEAIIAVALDVAARAWAGLGARSGAIVDAGMGEATVHRVMLVGVVNAAVMVVVVGMALGVAALEWVVGVAAVGLEVAAMLEVVTVSVVTVIVAKGAVARAGLSGVKSKTASSLFDLAGWQQPSEKGCYWRRERLSVPKAASTALPSLKSGRQVMRNGHVGVTR